jgi:hypothetical protein
MMARDPASSTGDFLFEFRDVLVDDRLYAAEQ